MKYFILIAILVLAPIGSLPSELTYTLTTDCNGYSPIESGFYTKECI